MQNALRIVRYNYRRLARPKVIDIGGIRIEARSAPISSTIRRSLYRERYERKEIELLNRVLRPGDRLLDIGAGIGVTSLFSARKIGGENVVAVEANPYLIEIFKRNCALNNVKIDILNCLLFPSTPETDEVEFYINKQFWSSSAVRKSDHAIKVKALPISETLRKGITVINADIEGAEAGLFGEMREFFSVEKILLETHTRYIGAKPLNDMLRHLMEMGFMMDFTLSSDERIVLFR